MKNSNKFIRFIYLLKKNKIITTHINPIAVSIGQIRECPPCISKDFLFGGNCQNLAQGRYSFFN